VKTTYKPVRGHPGYLVGTDGSVWTVWAKNSGPIKNRLPSYRRLTPSIQCGYPRVKIDRLDFKVHQLVLQTFVGPCPPGMECRHLDGDKMNCHLSNLTWGTRQENMADRTRLGEHGNKSRPGETHGRAKLTDEDVRLIRSLRPETTYPALMKRFNVSLSTLKAIVKGKAWTHLLENDQ
jgi:hypothetical protein